MFILLVLAVLAQVTVLPRSAPAPTKDYPIRDRGKGDMEVWVPY